MAPARKAAEVAAAPRKRPRKEAVSGKDTGTQKAKKTDVGSLFGASCSTTAAPSTAATSLVPSGIVSPADSEFARPVKRKRRSFEDVEEAAREKMEKA